MGFSQFIRNIDQYGQSPTFNFNRSGTSVTSLLGSFVTIIVVIIKYSYLGKLLYQMITTDLNTLSLTEQVVDLKELGEIKYSSMGMLIYFQMLSSNPMTLLNPITYNTEDFHQYLDLAIFNDNFKEGDSKFKPTGSIKIKTKQCTRKDFDKHGASDIYDRIYKTND